MVLCIQTVEIATLSSESSMNRDMEARCTYNRKLFYVF
jgi:hypothetical protein